MKKNLNDEVALCFYLKTLTATAYWKTLHLDWEREGRRNYQLVQTGTKNYVEYY